LARDRDSAEIHDRDREDRAARPRDLARSALAPVDPDARRSVIVGVVSERVECASSPVVSRGGAMLRVRICRPG